MPGRPLIIYLPIHDTVMGCIFGSMMNQKERKEKSTIAQKVPLIQVEIEDGDMLHSSPGHPEAQELHALFHYPTNLTDRSH